MQTDILISKLTREVRPVSRRAIDARLNAALVSGAAVACIALLMTIGLRPDLAAASATAPFWMKWMFTLSVGWGSLSAVRRVAQPGVGVGWIWLGLAAPFAVVLMMAIGELMLAAPDERLALVLGRTASICLAAIIVLAIPTFIGLLLAFRRFAPTRLSVAGGLSGVLAASVAASVYALACPEQTAAFMTVWYTLGIAACGIVGAFVGKWLMQW